MSKGQPQILAHFTPQAWVNDYAIDVDPEGPQEWDATISYYELPYEYRCKLGGQYEQWVLDVDDCLKDDPYAPEWVREWQGPFSLFIKQGLEP